MTITRRCILLLAGPALAPASARAQGFPTRPISLVVAYPAGGPDRPSRRLIRKTGFSLKVAIPPPSAPTMRKR